jgi:hypothetical protein
VTGVGTLAETLVLADLGGGGVDVSVVAVGVGGETGGWETVEGVGGAAMEGCGVSMRGAGGECEGAAGGVVM